MGRRKAVRSRRVLPGLNGGTGRETPSTREPTNRPSLRRRLTVTGVSAACLAAAAYTLSPLGGGAVPDTSADASAVLATQAAAKTRAVGVRFTVKSAGQISGARLASSRYASVGQVSLWKADGTLLGKSSRKGVGVRGVRYVTLTQAAAVKPGETYTVSYAQSTNRQGRVTQRNSAGPANTNLHKDVVLGEAVAGTGTGIPQEVRRVAGVTITPVFAAATPTPSPTPTTPVPSTTPTAPQPSAPSGGSGGGGIPSSFPNASNTGVPAGTKLSPYTGTCSVRQNLVIEAKQVNCDLMVYSGAVTIRNSKVNGVVINDEDTGSLNIVDSEIDGGKATRNVVGSRQVTILRSNIHGGKDSVQCNYKCTVRDSWLHGQYLAPGNTGHLQAFLSNGGQDMTLIHNTLSCDVKINNVDGGCTAAASMFGDFEPLRNFTFDGNLFVASTEMSYCAYAGYGVGKPYGTQVSGVVFTNNVFQRGSNGKCGLYGSITSFGAGLPGAVWKNNVWDDGKAVASAE